VIPSDLCRLWQRQRAEAQLAGHRRLAVCVWFLSPAGREGVSSSRSKILQVRPFSNKNCGLLQYQAPPFRNSTPTYRIRPI
jgi:hypothetical protein